MPSSAVFPVTLVRPDHYDGEEHPAPTPAYINPWNDLLYVEGDDAPKVALPVCPTCKGTGSFPGARVPYGSTTAQLPDEPCDTCYGSRIGSSQIEGLQWALRYAFVAGGEYVRNNVVVSAHAEWDAPSDNDSENKAKALYPIEGER